VAPVTTPQPPRQPGQPNPPAQANANQATQTAEKTGPSTSRRDATTNYEVDRVVRHVQQAPGGVKRLSVAVVVNYRQKLDAKGKPVTEALSAKELAQIENLTKEAMGYSADRGDSLNVVNSPFTDNAEKEPELPLWKQPQMIDLAKTGVGYLLLAILAMFLWFKVARPVLRKYTAPPLPAPSETTEASEAVLLPPEEAQNPEVLRLAAKYESDLALVRDAAQRDPRLVASVIKNWMAHDERQ
jgi:flagellar M-ring protein FliF